MKKTTLLLLSLYLVSIAYAAIQYYTLDANFILSFLNAIGVFSIALFIIVLILLLSSNGYFDVFGYTFKRTYLMITNGYKKMDEKDQEKYRSYYDYSLTKSADRLEIQPSFLLSSFIFIALNLTLSFLYAFK